MRALRARQVLAWLLLANGALGCAAAAAAWPQAPAQWPWPAILGAASGCLLLKGMSSGLWGGLLSSVLQSLRYLSFVGTGSFGAKWAMSLAVVLHVRDGILVVNLLALALALMCAGLLCRRRGAPAAR